MNLSKKLKFNLIVWVCVIAYTLFFSSYISIESYHPFQSFIVRCLVLIIFAIIWFFILVLLALKQRKHNLNENIPIHLGKIFLRLPKKIRQIILSIIAIFLLILATAWATGFYSSAKYIQSIHKAMANYNNSLKQKNDFETIGVNLKSLMILRQAAQIKDQNYSNWWIHVGYTFPNKTNQKINETYHNELRNTFQSYILTDMQQVIQRYINQDWIHANQYDTLLEKANLYQWLSSYLMFQQIKHMNKNQIQDLMLNYWQSTLPEHSNTIHHLQLLLTDLLDLPLPSSINLNQKIINQARSILGNDGAIIKSYITLKTQASMQKAPPLNIGGDGANRVFQSDQDIPFLYTKNGWYNFIQSNIVKSIHQAASQQWVFGNTEKSSFSEINLSTITTGVTSLYWRDYGQIWQQQFNHLKLKHFDDIQQAISLTKLLSTPKSPLLISIKQLSDNFDQNNTNGYPSYIAQIKVFSNNTPLVEELVQQINHLHEKLVMIQTAHNENQQAYQLAKLIAKGKPTPLASILEIASKAPPPIQNWLNDLVNNTVQAIFNLAQGYIIQQWDQQIKPSCLLNLNHVAPFNINSNSSLPLDKFTSFFGNDKKLMSFINKYAIPFMSTNIATGQIKFIPSFKPHTIVSHQIFGTLSATYDINSLLFSSKNGDRPSLQFSLTPRYLSQNLSQIEIHYNNSSFIYNNGPIFPTQMTWPAKINNNIIVTYTDINGAKYTNSYYGQWGLIKLLQSSELISEVNNKFQIAFSHGDKKAYYDLEISGNGYFPSIYDFKNFKCQP